MQKEQWEKWRQGRPLSFVALVSERHAEVPYHALYNEAMEVALLRVIGSPKMERDIADYIAHLRHPEHSFTIKQVNSKLFIVYMHDKQDLDKVLHVKWEFAASDIIMAKQWQIGDSVVEDAIESIP